VSFLEDDANDDSHNRLGSSLQCLSNIKLLMTTSHREPHNRRKAIVNTQVFCADLSYCPSFFTFSPPSPRLSCGTLVDQTWRRQWQCPLLVSRPLWLLSIAKDPVSVSSGFHQDALCAEEWESLAVWAFRLLLLNPHSDVCYRNLYLSSARESLALSFTARRCPKENLRVLRFVYISLTNLTAIYELIV
jgi:hypothetical protein